MSSLVIVDSGSANLNSVYKAAIMVSLQPIISDDPKVISAATAVIFPGVGSFSHAAEAIKNKA
ncbi:MAG: imidazole glycerol phosphate synthase subunit HisH, partial [Dethiobacteria bacterium]|nr:imidazole glycerol phosphate synthase subunit HisH [Dethiobacteria bacterium]